MQKRFLLVLPIFVFVALAKVTFAQIVFTEIMYDPQGGDTGHEWVEILNQGADPVDLSQCKSKSPCRFIEGGNNHELASASGSPILAPGAYAIIADSPQTFLGDHPGYSGTVVDSSFSLKNTGETIAFKMPDGSVSDTVTYSPDMGATGDGNSLQKIGGVWKSAQPTPGNGDAPAVGDSTNTTATNVTSSTVTSSSANLSTFPADPQIFADAGPQTKIVSVGAPVTLTGRVWGLKKEPIENARMTWAFGDGATAEGATVSHIYYYPGEYTAVLDAASGFFSASDRVRIMAVAPSLTLRTGGDATRSFVAIENFGNDELDLSGWQVVESGKTFVLPKNTFINAHKILTIASEVSGLVVAATTTAALNFPNGTAVPLAGTTTAGAQKISENSTQSTSNSVALSQKSRLRSESQSANALAALSENETGQLPAAESSSLWMWYSGIALLGALGALAIRMTRKKAENGQLVASDFEIIEENDD